VALNGLEFSSCFALTVHFINDNNRADLLTARKIWENYAGDKKKMEIEKEKKFTGLLSMF